MDNLVQNAYEDSREYAWRFQEAVDKGYSAADLAVDLINKCLIGLFINGLRDKQICTYVQLEKPDTLAITYSTANNASRAVGKAKCNTRKVEPMEVGSVSSAAGKPPPMKPPLEQLVKTLQGEAKSLHKMMSNGCSSAQAYWTSSVSTDPWRSPGQQATSTSFIFYCPRSPAAQLR